MQDVGDAGSGPRTALPGPQRHGGVARPTPPRRTAPHRWKWCGVGFEPTEGCPSRLLKSAPGCPWGTVSVP